MDIERGLLVYENGALEIELKPEKKTYGDCKVLKSNRYIGVNDFISSLSSFSTSQILPNNCKFISGLYNNYITLVIEEPPRIRTIKIKASVLGDEVNILRETGKLKEFGLDLFLASEKTYVNDKYYELSLSFPYVVFVITLACYKNLYSNLSSRVFLRTSPLKSINDRLIISPTTNFDGQNLCSPYSNGTTIKSTVDSIIDGFWGSIFTEHGSQSYLKYLERDDNINFLMWQYLTQKDPNFVFSADWIYSENTLEDIISKNVKYLTSNVFIDIILGHIGRKMEEKGFTTYYEYVFNLDDRQVLLSNGDEIETDDGKRYIIEYFSKKYDSNEVAVFMESFDGEKVSLEINKENVRRIIKQRKEINEIEIKGKKIKCGDIVSYKVSNENKRVGVVKKIRKNRLGMLEMKIGMSKFYIVTDELVDSIEVFDDGLYNLNKNCFIEVTSYKKPVEEMVFYEGKLVDIEDTGNVVLKFVDKQNQTFSFRVDQCSLYKEEFMKGVKVFPVVESHGFLFFNSEWAKREGYEYFVKGNKLLTRKNPRSNAYYNIKNNEIDETLDLAFKDKDGNGIHIKSLTTQDIDFNVGDYVFIFGKIGRVDIGKITKIIKNLDTYSINFEIEDSDGKKYVEQYIKIISEGTYFNRMNANGYINNKFIVKFYPRVGNLVAESKIICKSSKIPNFPKSNINKILGFILDFENPLIVASNGQTIWYDENFERLFDVISPSDKKYNLKKYELHYSAKSYIPRIGDLLKYNHFYRDIKEAIELDEINNNAFKGFVRNYPSAVYQLSRKRIEPVGLLLPRF